MLQLRPHVVPHHIVSLSQELDQDICQLRLVEISSENLRTLINTRHGSMRATYTHVTGPSGPFRNEVPQKLRNTGYHEVKTPSPEEMRLPITRGKTIFTLGHHRFVTKALNAAETLAAHGTTNIQRGTENGRKVRQWGFVL